VLVAKGFSRPADRAIDFQKEEIVMRKCKGSVNDGLVPLDLTFYNRDLSAF